MEYTVAGAKGKLLGHSALSSRATETVGRGLDWISDTLN